MNSKRRLFNVLTFIDCNLCFERVIAKDLSFESSIVSGDFVAQQNLKAKKHFLTERRWYFTWRK